MFSSGGLRCHFFLGAFVLIPHQVFCRRPNHRRWRRHFSIPRSIRGPLGVVRCVGVAMILGVDPLTDVPLGTRRSVGFRRIHARAERHQRQHRCELSRSLLMTSHTLSLMHDFSIRRNTESPCQIRCRSRSLRYPRAAGRERNGREEANRHRGFDVAPPRSLVHLQGFAEQPVG